jgi:hypothetical protein
MWERLHAYGREIDAAAQLRIEAENAAKRGELTS